MPHTLQDIQSCKDFDKSVIYRDIKNLCDFDGLTNPKKLCGNRTLYKYQFRNIIKCKRENWYSLEYIMKNEELRNLLWSETLKRNRSKKGEKSTPTDVFEVWRINHGAIVCFKASTAKYIYKLFNATSVLDPTAGWGGRMLGAMSLGIKYTGIDTNINLKEGYDKMIKDIVGNEPNYKMIWKSCLDIDYSKLDYDLVLTSPPYINMELYENMTPFKNNQIFYREFLIPMLNNCYQYLKKGGHMCINISPKMFKDLMTYDYKEPDSKIDLRQSMGKNYATKSQDYIYVWNK